MFIKNLLTNLNIHSRYFSTSSLRSANLKKFDGKVAIVTASTDGIGFGIARKLVSEGCKVMISSRKEANVAKAVDQLQNEFGKEDVHGIQCHVGNAEDRENLVKQTLDKMGSIDIFVSNAAANPFFGRTLDCNESQWDKIFDINVKAAFLLTQQIVPEMLKKGNGSIIYVSSIAGYNTIPMLGPYSISKTALLGLTKALSMELADCGIRVNGVAPGIVKTKFASMLTDSEEISEKVLENLHIKRFGTPEDIAGVVSFLCSDDAQYVTGETIVVSGGGTTRL